MLQAKYEISNILYILPILKAQVFHWIRTLKLLRLGKLKKRLQSSFKKSPVFRPSIDIGIDEEIK